MCLYFYSSQYYAYMEEEFNGRSITQQGTQHSSETVCSYTMSVFYRKITEVAVLC